jgi:hypothetical protein
MFPLVRAGSRAWRRSCLQVQLSDVRSHVSTSALKPQPSWSGNTNVYKQNKQQSPWRFSQQANHTDHSTAACRGSSWQMLRLEGVAWSVQRVPTAVNLSFLGQTRYFISQAAPQLSCEVEWTSFQTHYYSENLLALGIEPGTSGAVARNSDR